MGIAGTVNTGLPCFKCVASKYTEYLFTRLFMCESKVCVGRFLLRFSFVATPRHQLT
jgi:hypothetical protein